MISSCHVISAIIPALRFEPALETSLARFRAWGINDLIISCPVPDPALQAAAAKHNARMTVCPPGRGSAMASGAAVARTDWLLFVHADTVIDAPGREEVLDYIRKPANSGRAAYFRFKQDVAGHRASVLETLVSARCRLFALPYGDQGLLIHRDLYCELGGFRTDLPLMEDVDLIKRLGRRRLAPLETAAITSARRYERGYLRRMMRNAVCLTLFSLGVSPMRIARLYERG